MENFVTMLRIRIKNGQYIANAAQYPYDGNINSRELIRQYYNLLNTDAQDATVTYHAVYIIDSKGTMLRGETFDYREQEVTA